MGLGVPEGRVRGATSALLLALAPPLALSLAPGLALALRDASVRLACAVRMVGQTRPFFFVRTRRKYFGV